MVRHEKMANYSPPPVNNSPSWLLPTKSFVIKRTLRTTGYQSLFCLAIRFPSSSLYCPLFGRLLQPFSPATLSKFLCLEWSYLNSIFSPIERYRSLQFAYLPSVFSSRDSSKHPFTTPRTVISSSFFPPWIEI